MHGKESQVVAGGCVFALPEDGRTWASRCRAVRDRPVSDRDRNACRSSRLSTAVGMGHPRAVAVPVAETQERMGSRTSGLAGRTAGSGTTNHPVAPGRRRQRGQQRGG